LESRSSTVDKRSKTEGLIIIDIFTKESLGIEGGGSCFPFFCVAEVLERLKLERGKPEGIEKPIFKNLWNYWKN